MLAMHGEPVLSPRVHDPVTEPTNDELGSGPEASRVEDEEGPIILLNLEAAAPIHHGDASSSNGHSQGWNQGGGPGSQGSQEGGPGTGTGTPPLYSPTSSSRLSPAPGAYELQYTRGLLAALAAPKPSRASPYSAPDAHDALHPLANFSDVFRRPASLADEIYGYRGQPAALSSWPTNSSLKRRYFDRLHQVGPRHARLAGRKRPLEHMHACRLKRPPTPLKHMHVWLVCAPPPLWSTCRHAG